MKNKLAILFIVIFASTLYALTLHGIYGNPQPQDFKNNLDQASRPFELSPERGRYAHVLALAQTGSYALDKRLSEITYPDVGYYQDRYYSYFAPGVSYLALPFYLLGAPYQLGQLFTFGFVSLVSILALIFLFKICREVLNMPIWAALLSVLVFAFGSTAWSYATTLYQHHFTTLFMLSSFYAVWKYRQQGKASWLWAALVWLDYALAISVDYPNAVLLLPVMVYLTISAFQITQTEKFVKVSLRLSLLATACVFVALSALHAYHNQVNFGAWSRLSGTLPGVKQLEQRQAAEIAGEAVAAPAEKSAIKFFREENLPNSFGTLFFSADRGLFFYAPIFLLAVYGIYTTIRRKRIGIERAILFFCVAVNVFVYSSWGDPWGGWAYGPRYLIPSMAILAIFTSVGILNAPRLLPAKIIAFLLFLYSSGIGLLGVLTTNAVPPKIEADFLHMKYNFLLNLDFLKHNQSASFFYNTFTGNELSVWQYFLILYGVLGVAAFLLLFIFGKKQAYAD